VEEKHGYTRGFARGRTERIINEGQSVGQRSSSASKKEAVNKKRIEGKPRTPETIPTKKSNGDKVDEKLAQEKKVEGEKRKKVSRTFK